MPLTRTTRQAPRAPGFTIIELLVVVGVISLLITLLTAAGARLIDSQRRHNTEQIMRNVATALDQFATEAPLRSIYNSKGRETFGKYPPYQLANTGLGVNSVARTLERAHPLVTTGDPSVPSSLAERLSRDISGIAATQGTSDILYVVINTPSNSIDGLDDSRALYTYLKVFSPASLDLIPDEYIKPLYPASGPVQPSYVNTKGTGTAAGNLDRDDILAVHDAWGVPLDYMMYAKCEWMLPEGAPDGGVQFVATERRPVLRSLGIKREVYDVEVEAVRAMSNPSTDQKFDYSKWIFSEQLPTPAAGLNDGGNPSFYRQGNLPTPNPANSANGWTRVVGLGESYSYLPEGDKAWQFAP